MTRTPDCDDERLWAVAVGVLEGRDLERHERHLSDCTRCRNHLELIRADVEALGCYAGEPVRSPEQLAEATLERSRALAARGRRLRWLALGLVLLGTLAGGLFTAHVLTARSLARRDLWTLEHAIQRIQNQDGRYPADERALAEALTRLADPRVRLDPTGHPLDPWGQPYRYRFPGEHVEGQFDLWSPGYDGEDEAGAPDDLTNWR